MPWIIEYDVVLERMRERRFKSNYYNSGAFGFDAPATDVRHVAWVGPDDPTIRPAARPFVRPVRAPYERTLADLCTRTWLADFPGRVWVMPQSHWAYELSFGSRDWMPALLENVGVDPGLLENRNNAAAIEFAVDEARHLRHFVERLLEMLLGSDFVLAFPAHPILCTIHHHKQLWWSTTDDKVLRALERAAATEAATDGAAPEAPPP